MFRHLHFHRLILHSSACIIVALSVIRAPLNQQATIVQGNVIFPTNGSMKLRIAQELPPGYAGVTERLRGETTDTGMLTPDFIKVMNSYSQRTQLTMQNLTRDNSSTQCNGTCSFTVKVRLSLSSPSRAVHFTDPPR